MPSTIPFTVPSTVLSPVTVSVPATTANLGPGFDCLGAALTWHNQFQFRAVAADAPTLTIAVHGSEADRVSRDRSNLLYQAFVKGYEFLQQPPPAVEIEIALRVPLARGLGSSATAIVAGLLGANALAGFPLSQTEILHLAIDLEGHPDNVVPALLGGCRLSARGDQGWQICDVPWHPEVVPVLAVPNFELSTETARQVLPPTYSRSDAIFNLAHLGLLLRGLETGNGLWLRNALADRIHQPYRQNLIPGFEAVHRAALTAEAYGLVISGAGPTLLALTTPKQSLNLQTVLREAWTAQGVEVEVRELAIDPKGATVG